MAEDREDRQSIPESLADEPTRKKLAAARKRTRARLATELKVTNEAVRRWEKRCDLYISTMRQCAKRIGSNVWLEVTFPGHPPVILSGLGEDKGKIRAKKKAGNGAKSKAKTRRAA